MKQFKDLEIIGPDERLLAFIEKLSANLPAHWRRDHEAEARLEGVAHASKDAGFAFVRDAKEGDPESLLFLVRECGRLYVSNIVPRKTGRLSISEYNRVLDDFESVLRDYFPLDNILRIHMTSDEAVITDWVSPEAAKLLERFSKGANKSTGSSHPGDFDRWAEFLVKVHRERSCLRADVLARWLVEEENWPPEQADKLAIEYDFARDLLRVYDESR